MIKDSTNGIPQLVSAEDTHAGTVAQESDFMVRGECPNFKLAMKSISCANIAAWIDFDQDHFYQPPHSVNQVAVKMISSANSLRDWFASD
jgi:hypothetical protein